MELECGEVLGGYVGCWRVRQGSEDVRRQAGSGIVGGVVVGTGKGLRLSYHILKDVVIYVFIICILSGPLSLDVLDMQYQSCELFEAG